MTVRAVIIGLVLGTAIASLGYLNDWVFKQAEVASDLVPISAYGLLVLGLLVVNPLLRCIGKVDLRATEWAVVVSLMLVACVVPGAGLLWNFSNTIVMPHHIQANTPGWTKYNLVRYAPPAMLVDPTRNPEEVVGGFVRGLRPGSGMSLFDPAKGITPRQVPWYGWTRTLWFWLCFMGLTFVAGILIALIVHSQWAKRERLRYPIADFTAELIAGSGEGYLPRVFHNRMFWIGFALAVSILLVNGTAAWFPDQTVSIPLWFDLTIIRQTWPKLAQVEGWWAFLKPQLYFAVIGFAYLVSSEVSFSLGIANIVFIAASLALTEIGVDMSKDYLAGGLSSFLTFGAYVGAGLTILYIGRRYYGALLRSALGIAPKERTEPSLVWAFRFLLLSGVAMVLMLVLVAKLNWMLATLAITFSGLLFLVISRISAETGLFFIQPAWHAVGVLVALFGVAALGPHELIALAVLSTVMTIDPRVCMIPMAATALQLSEKSNVSPAKLSPYLVLAALVALVLGVLTTVWTQYTYGGGVLYEWANDAAGMPFRMLERAMPQFASTPGRPEGLQLQHIHPYGRFLYAAGIGLGLVLVCNFFRLRFRWWPIHPVLFLVVGTMPMQRIGASFLVGWFLKVAITKLGGADAYRRYKPIFIGMIAGAFTAGVLWAIVGYVYYAKMGRAGPVFMVHP